MDRHPGQPGTATAAELTGPTKASSRGGVIVKVRVRKSNGKTTYSLWCPACDDLVCIDDSWGWNGDTERPTFAPSLLTRISLDQWG